jgi:hypothetical protein
MNRVEAEIYNKIWKIYILIQLIDLLIYSQIIVLYLKHK